MSFHKQTLGQLLGLTPDEQQEFRKRAAGFLKNSATPARIDALSFIVKNIKGKSVKAKTSKHYEWGMHNPLFQKYGWKIEELYLSGMGVQKVSKTLRIQYKVSISKSQVHRFIQHNEIKRHG